jgi:Na+-driven multidrug efflux pump
MNDGVVKRVSIVGAIYVALATVLTVLFPWGWVGWWGPGIGVGGAAAVMAMAYLSMALVVWVMYGKEGE